MAILKFIPEIVKVDRNILVSMVGETLAGLTVSISSIGWLTIYQYSGWSDCIFTRGGSTAVAGGPC